MFTGAAHGDEQQRVSIERDGGEVRRLLGLGADAVLNSRSALHREEPGAGGGSPENKRDGAFVPCQSCVQLRKSGGGLRASHRLVFCNKWRDEAAAQVMTTHCILSSLEGRG